MIIERQPWSAQAEQGLRVSVGADLAAIRGEVNAGISKLWRCRSATAAGWIVTREEPGELVIVCGEGSGFFEFAPWFVERARAAGLTIRTHVQRPGLIRMWRRLGVNFDHYVLRG